MKTNSVKRLTISALLIAMGIIIPMVMPRITIGPASFTLASHVPVFIAMFISPVVAIAVSLGTGFGFFLSATPIIALRALSHLIFAVIGAVILQKHPEILINKEGKFTLLNGKLQLFNVGIGVIHSGCRASGCFCILHNGQLARNLLYSWLHVFYFSFDGRWWINS